MPTSREGMAELERQCAARTSPILLYGENPFVCVFAHGDDHFILDRVAAEEQLIGERYVHHCWYTSAQRIGDEPTRAHGEGDRGTDAGYYVRAKVFRRAEGGGNDGR